MDVDSAKPRVLIADDEWMSRQLMRAFLERGGYAVLEARNGQEALRMAREHQPELMLLDVRMHDLSGFEVCARLKADPATFHIKIIILSALAGKKETAKAETSGADLFLSKSMAWTSIMAQVAALTARP